MRATNTSPVAFVTLPTLFPSFIQALPFVMIPIGVGLIFLQLLSISLHLVYYRLYSLIWKSACPCLHPGRVRYISCLPTTQINLTSHVAPRRPPSYLYICAMSVEPHCLAIFNVSSTYLVQCCKSQRPLSLHDGCISCQS